MLLLAGPVIWSLFTPASDLTLKSAGETVSRGIASVSPLSTPVPKTGRLSHPVTVDWNLSGTAFTKKIAGTHLRLKGLLKGYKAEAIVNESNGFTASVFLTGNEFTTDFIELQEGQNRIQVEVEDAKGQKTTKKLEITRLPASL